MVSWARSARERSQSDAIVGANNDNDEVRTTMALVAVAGAPEHGF